MIREGQYDFDSACNYLLRLIKSGYTLEFEGHDIPFISPSAEGLKLYVRRYYLQNCYIKLCSEKQKYCTTCKPDVFSYETEVIKDEDMRRKNDDRFRAVMIEYEYFAKNEIQAVKVFYDPKKNYQLRFQFIYDLFESQSILINYWG